MDSKQSPRIEKIQWGRVWVAGLDQPFKDVKLFPGGARAWDWRETDTRHVPGIQTADILELVEQGAAVIVLSTGYYKRLRVTAEALQMLDEAGIEVVVLDTKKAVARYNELAHTEAVGALIHSTC